jgi:hypothetical protein
MKDNLIKFTMFKPIFNLFKYVKSFFKSFKSYFSNFKSNTNIAHKFLFISKFFTHIEKINLNTCSGNFRKINKISFKHNVCPYIENDYKFFLFKNALKIIQIVKKISITDNIKRKMIIIVEKKNIKLICQMLTYLLKKSKKIKIKILFINKNIKKSSILKKIYILEKLNDNFKTVNLNKKEENIIDKNFIYSNLGNPEIGKIIFTSGLNEENFFIFKILHCLGYSKRCILKI